MARATFDGVGKRYGETPALSDFSLDAGDGELVAVVGPSGCGKSTVLRLTAGLETPDAGTIAMDGGRIDRLAPGDRDVAMVFQSYALYPHLTVRGNVEFPLRMRGVGRDERARRVGEVAELLELGHLLDRRPAALSGGQRQRVALARALVRRPRLFLLDEPLSNLDARLRATVRRWLRELQRRLAVTTLYVTHDQTEAMTLGDRVVVLSGGRIQQVGTPLDVYERPANAFVAAFVGTPPMNLLEADVDGDTVRVAGTPLPLPPALRAAALGHGGRLLVGVRPEAFAPARGAPDELLAAAVDPSTREVLGGETLVRARLGSGEAIVRLFGIVHDLPSRVAAPASALYLFDAASGARLGP